VSEFLSQPIRDALILAPAIALQLGVWEGEPSIHTRDPAPDAAPYPLIVCAGDISVGDTDGLTSRRPFIRRDVRIYGKQPDHYRVVEDLGWAIRTLFHRQKWALAIPGYRVVEIECDGPMIAPTSDESIVGRIVSLRLSLKDLAT
jgi:hypothetical protein